MLNILNKAQPVLTAHQQLILTVRDRTHVIYQGPVKAVTSLNLKGRFDVLPEHANFISIITDYLVLHKTDGTKQELKISRGVLKTSGNTVSVYLGLTASSNVPPTPTALSKALVK